MQSLVGFMARWFLTCLEDVLRGDLVRAYHSHRDDQPFATGRIVPLPTARAYYSGRLTFTCDYELFDTDTPINRVPKAAARTVLTSPRSTPQTRRCARPLAFAMDELGPRRPGDPTRALTRG